MDYIKKTICLESARSRTQGLMPYYELGAEYPDVSGRPYYSMSELGLTEASGSNGNWGQIVANPWFLAACGKTYDSMLQKYYSMLNTVRGGIKLRKVETKDGEIIYTEDVGSFYLSGNCFAGGEEPDSLYEYAAYDSADFYSSEIDSQREETRRIYRYTGSSSADDTYIVLIDDFDKFMGMAGYLSGTTYKEKLSGFNPIDIYSGADQYQWARYCYDVDLCIGKINVPARIYNEHIKVPKSMPCADVSSYIEWLLDNQNLSANCCNERLWNDMGGEDMLEFLIDNSGSCETTREVLNSLDYAIPYIEMPLLLTQNFTDIGVLTNLDGEVYSASSKTRAHRVSGHPQDVLVAIPVSGYCGTTIDVIAMGSERLTYPTTEEYEANPSGYTNKPVEVESLLKTLRATKKYIDDEDNVLPGLFKMYSGSPTGKYYKCEKSGEEWSISECDGTDLINGDGMTSEEIANAPSGTNYYRSVTTKAAAKRIAEVYDEEPKDENEPVATKFYFRAKYDNSEDSPMTNQYMVGNATNLYCDESGETWRGDIIVSANTDEISGVTYFETIYAIGAYLTFDGSGYTYESDGDIYYEKHVFDDKHCDYVKLDGVDNVPVWSEYVDFVGDEKEFYSTRYNLYRTGNTANIIEATTGEEWTKEDGDGLSYAYDAYLTKEEYLINFSLPPKVDVNVTIDRGGLSAFESHYKLSECNTMQDLVNYGNNFFNL